MDSALQVVGLCVVGLGRAPRAHSRLYSGEALSNRFSEKSDSMLILWMDSLKRIKELGVKKVDSSFDFMQ